MRYDVSLYLIFLSLSLSLSLILSVSGWLTGLAGRLAEWLALVPFPLFFSACSSFLFSSYTRALASTHHIYPTHLCSLVIAHTSYTLSLALSIMRTHKTHTPPPAQSLIPYFTPFHLPSHSFPLKEYNSYVVTGGRDPMSISSGIRDERYSLSFCLIFLF